MENKTIVSVTCPACKTTMDVTKALAKEYVKFECPRCKHLIMLRFDITANPQTFVYLSPQPAPAPAPSKNETVVPASTPVAQQGQTAPKPITNDGKTIYGNPAGMHGNQGFAPKHPVEHNPTMGMLRLNLVKLAFLPFNNVSYRLNYGANFIGRKDGETRIDITLDDMHVSRGKSINLEVKPGVGAPQIILRVLHSANPVTVRGRYSLTDGQELEIRPGDEMQIGKSKFKIVKE